MPDYDRPGPPKAHTLRLLLPFFFERDAVARATQHLSALTQVGKKPWTCWTPCAPVPNFYRQETLPSVTDFLFGGRPGGCGYLRVPAETVDFWFKKGGSFQPADAPSQASPDAPDEPEPPGRPQRFEVTLTAPGIEIFLSPHGAGVLSVSFAAGQANDLLHLRELNYRLSQGRAFTSFAFHLPHDERSPNLPPAPDAPLAERLGRGGGAFKLMELAAFLLAPLGDLGYLPMQEQFAVYSVTRFGAGADLADPQVAESLRPLLAALAHVEECSHPGTLKVAEQLLNARHWAAAGSLAAVHLVADQDPPHPYDEQRVPSVLHKYFIPFLITLLQRVALQRLLGEARLALIAEEAQPGAAAEDRGQGLPARTEAARLRGLNRHALAFTVNGCFTEISSREALNQYYELVQKGLRVRDSFGTVQQALRDAEAMDNDRFQGDALVEIGAVTGKLERLVTEAGKHARLVAHVQSKVEWLEVFFVSYYFTALMYYVNHDGSLFSHDYSVWTLLAAPLVSGGIAFFGLKPHRLHGSSQPGADPKEEEAQGQDPDHTKPHRERTWWFLLQLILAFGIWLGVGLRFFPPEDQAHPGGHQGAPARGEVQTHH